MLCLCTERGGPICHKNNSWMVPDCKKDREIDTKKRGKEGMKIINRTFLGLHSLLVSKSENLGCLSSIL